MSLTRVAAPARGRPRREGVDEAVVAAAARLVGEVGMAGISMDLVAQRAGVSKATIYRRWASKEELVIEVMRRFVEPTAAPDTGSVAEDVRQFAVALAQRFAHQRKSDVLPHLVAAACYDESLRAALDHYSRSRQSTIREILRRGVRRGELPADYDIDVAVDMLLGAFLYRRLMSGGSLSADVAARISAILVPAPSTADPSVRRR